MTIDLDYEISEEEILDPYKTREMSFEILEARNFFGFHGYIQWVEESKTTHYHGVFPRELLEKMSFISRMFYDKSRLPQQGKYMLVEKDKIHMVVVCPEKDREKFSYHTQTTISLLISFLNLVNKENEKMCAIINQDFIWLGNSQIAELTSKTIKGNCVIVNTFYPTTAEILKFNGLKYLEEETLDVIGSDDLTQELWTKPIWACRVV
jgi:hypothetical protein